MTATKTTTSQVDPIEAAVAAGKETVSKAGAEAFQGYEDFVGLGKDNVAAVFDSSTVLAKGLMDFNEMWLGLVQASVHDGVAATKAVLGAHSVPEALGVQISLVKANTAKAVTENRKMTDMSAKVAEGAMEPILKRVTATAATVEKFAKPLSV
ncbi:MAG: phasin family protein [Woeseiaceae bacterium]|jgi:phasin family protein|nr:phasin family protein [Rhodospirillales bacterium]MDP6993418.1 phasin family protein [Woeseiaceae bacterium]